MPGKLQIARYASISILLLSLLRAAALLPPFDLLEKGSRTNNLLPVWLEFQARKSQYMASPDFRLNYVSAASWLNSYVGEYRSALGLADLTSTPQPIVDDPGLRQSIEKYHPIDALEAIAEAAHNRRVVMINEEHMDSSHRAFTTELLRILQKQGFRYFAAEAFGSGITTARYPKVGRFYTDDPVFGDLIRRALDLGFTLLPYDAPSQCSDAKLRDFNTHGFGALGGDNCMEGRELGQARNLARLLAAHPAAKLLVHGGMGHILKTDAPFGHLMGWHFRELTKIDPLTIDQSSLSERADRQPEYPIIAAKYADRTAPFVLRSAGGFFLPQNSDGADIAVIHPPAKYRNGRPAWLSTGGWRQPRSIAQLPAYRAAVPELRKAGVTLLQVFLLADKPDAVPVDQFLIADPLKPAVPMLPDGKYRLRIVDRDGKTLVAFNL